ncbi:MAG: hypothetical protein IPP66_09835 [Anaerolineales bacterium]|nr:hypothetical protein [Anaerolineales bacterium]
MKKTIRKTFTVLLIAVLSACTTGTPLPPTEPPAESLFGDPQSSATPPSNGSPALAATPSHEAPPPAMLTINGTTQTAGIGTYCWKAATSSANSAEVCVDMVGVPTATEPLKSSLPFSGTLTLPLNDPPTQLVLTVFPASDANEIQLPNDAGNYRWWNFIEGYVSTLALQTSQEIKQDLQPGLYVFYVFAVWDGKGDVSYGFLVEAK